MPSLSDALADATAQLRAAGCDEPQREARALAAAVLNMDRAALLTQGERTLAAEEQQFLTAALARRATHEPLARILGHKEFWGLDFALNAATLVPRPDSETLVAASLEHFPDRQTPLRVLDLGTGSGCLLLSVLHEYPNATGLGVDCAPDAVTQAAVNAVTLGLAARAQFLTVGWHDATVTERLTAMSSRFDLILSNPPYIASAVIATLQPEVRVHDPALALDGGADGLVAYRLLTALLPALLAPNGFALLEIGYDQGESVPALCRAAGFTPTLRRDLAGQPRCVIMTHTPAKDY